MNKKGGDILHASRRPLRSFPILRSGLQGMCREIGSFIDGGSEVTKLVFCINPHSYQVAIEDKEFERALFSSSLLVPDGVGIVWALRFLGLRTSERVSGPDVYHAVMQELCSRGGSAFFLGSSQHTLKKLVKSVHQKYPNVNVVGHISPSFSNRLSEEESNDIVHKINGAEPDVLWVGMTAPKQEKWLAQYEDRLAVKLACAVGAVFDFEAGTAARAPKILQVMGLEWLFRSLISPARLGRRNAISNPKFVINVLREKCSVS